MHESTNLPWLRSLGLSYPFLFSLSLIGFPSAAAVGILFFSPPLFRNSLACDTHQHLSQEASQQWLAEGIWQIQRCIDVGLGKLNYAATRKKS